MTHEPAAAPHRAALGRRRFLRRCGWCTLHLLGASSLAATARFFFPRVVFEPPFRFVVGRAEEFPPGAVNSELVEKHRVWIVRRPSGEFLALKAECTHLGCTPRWLDSAGKFKCPCHGSGFRADGTNFEGPAPRPLDRLRLGVTADGRLEVDRSVVFRGVAGANSDDLYPESVLRV